MAKARDRTPPKDKLDEYRRKRDFERSREPRGEAEPSTGSDLLFVVQKHAARNLHYDFRLELDGVLKSWAVPKGPSLDPGQRPLAVHVEDHPLEYASFEGIIPAGQYGGGTVMVWDRGTWEPIGDPHAGYARGDLKFRLNGEKLRGSWVLVRMSDGERNWLLIKKKDEQSRSVRAYNVLAEEPRSALSGRSMDEIAADPKAVWNDGHAEAIPSAARERSAGPPRRKRTAPSPSAPDPSSLPGAVRAKLPAQLAPQLASLVKEAPSGDAWLHEIKLDGYRLLCRIDRGQVQLLTRNGHDWTERFLSVAAAMAHLPLTSATLDGEVVVLDAEGRSKFQALQNAFRGRGAPAFTYFLFDLPFAQGFDLTKVPLLQRKQFLRSVLRAAPAAAPTVQFSDHILGKGPTVFREACRAGLEGIISKRANSRYEARRSASWLKVKCTRRQEFVVGGFTAPSGSRTGFGALLLGYYDERGHLIYCGRVGAGFSDRSLGDLHRQLRERFASSPAFENPQADPDERSAQWVRPDLVVEVEFSGMTEEGLLRHAVFRGVRKDKSAANVVLERPEQVAGERTRAAAKVVRAPGAPDDALVDGVRISHPQRTVYPEDNVTKLDVAEYYRKIADRVLPHAIRRPLSLVRCPLGLAGDSFFQRSVGEGFPDAIRGIGAGGDDAQNDTPDEPPDDTRVPYLLIDDLTGLLSLVQMGVLEIHTWGCRADDLERPDELVFDLDPGPGIGWEDVVESARFLHGYLDRIGLRSFVKTSGGKGIHLLIPLVRRSGWDDVKAFARAVATDLVRIAPRNFVATSTKSLRRNRIYVDYLRNHRGATTVAPYSTRARVGACVSTPLSWDELSPELMPEDLTVRTVPDRLEQLKDDPWRDFFDLRQSITKKMKQSVGV